MTVTTNPTNPAEEYYGLLTRPKISASSKTEPFPGS